MPKPPIFQQQTTQPRRRRWRPSGPTQVDLYWSQKYGAYALKWHDTYHWDEMQPFMSYLKSAPYGEYQYDPDEKIWYFMEKYLSNIRAMFDALAPAHVFSVNFVEKPQAQTNFVKFISIDTYIGTFNKLTGVDIKNLDFSKAKREYFKACMRLHPDKGNDPAQMTELNVAWDAIQSEHFKIKKEITYE